jgi:hypothetical protein
VKKSTLKGIISNAKDRLIEQAALAYLNRSLLQPYGRATSLRVDSSEKTILIEAELKGESSPLQIELVDYVISQDGEDYFVTVKGIRTSREWLTTLAQNELLNRRFKVPAKTGRLLMQVL